MKTNIINLDHCATNDESKVNFKHRLTVYRFAYTNSPASITKMHVENLVATYGLEVVEKAIKAVKPKKQKAA